MGGDALFAQEGVDAVVGVFGREGAAETHGWFGWFGWLGIGWGKVLYRFCMVVVVVMIFVGSWLTVHS